MRGLFVSVDVFVHAFYIRSFVRSSDRVFLIVRRGGSPYGTVPYGLRNVPYRLE